EQLLELLGRAEVHRVADQPVHLALDGGELRADLLAHGREARRVELHPVPLDHRQHPRERQLHPVEQLRHPGALYVAAQPPAHRPSVAPSRPTPISPPPLTPSTRFLNSPPSPITLTSSLPISLTAAALSADTNVVVDVDVIVDVDVDADAAPPVVDTPPTP